MRIAISTENKNGLSSNVSHHFGRCPCYVFVDVDGQEITVVEMVDNPYAQQHQPGVVPNFINNHGAEVMLSGGMGRRAIAFFEQVGVHVATGADGTVQTALERYLGGELRGAEPCHDSVEHHKQGHHHE